MVNSGDINNNDNNIYKNDIIDVDESFDLNKLQSIINNERD